MGGLDQSEIGNFPLVNLESVTRVYGSDGLDVIALAGVSLTIRSGELCAIVGASGSGKSTLLNLLGTLDRPTNGRYFLDGEPVEELDDDTLAAIRNEKLG